MSQSRLDRPGGLAALARLLALQPLPVLPRFTAGQSRRGGTSGEPRDDDRAWWDTGPEPHRTSGITLNSRYLTMRDGVKIAVDLYLPQGLKPDTRLPAILFQTRYFRALTLRRPFGWLVPFLPPPLSTTYRTIRRFVSSGYAWVSVDVRGSGASFGWRRVEWSPEEVRDGAEVAEWIVGQPWSNGAIGATGISYDGIAAEFLASNRHPALKAIAPRFALFDAYTDAGFPGGLRHESLTTRWSRLNRALDHQRFEDIAGWPARALGVGVRPVVPDADLLARVIAEHSDNYDIHTESLDLEFRDDRAGNGLSVDIMSPWRHAGALRAADLPIYSVSGWLDSGFVRGTVNRFLNAPTAGSRLTLGPWQHGVEYNASPAAARRRSSFDHDGDLLRFFDYHLRGIDTGIAEEAPVHYYTIGANTWREAATWPPPATAIPLYLRGERRLAAEAPPADDGFDRYQVDLRVGSGSRSRWDPLVDSVAVSYGDRQSIDRRLLCYTSPPLAEDIEVTGHPLLNLIVASTAPDGAFFAYLEDVDPSGTVGYVSEGQLRAVDRRLSHSAAPYSTPYPYHSFRREDAEPLVPGEPAELTYDLLPISYLFRAGHRIRLALSGADHDHFATLPGERDEPPVWQVFRQAGQASQLVLPVTRGRMRFRDD